MRAEGGPERRGRGGEPGKRTDLERKGLGEVVDRGTDGQKKRHGGNTQKDTERIPEKDRHEEQGGDQKTGGEGGNPREREGGKWAAGRKKIKGDVKDGLRDGKEERGGEVEAEGQQKKRQEDWGWGIGREQDRRMGKTEVDMAGKPWADRQSDRNGGGGQRD